MNNSPQVLFFQAHSPGIVDEPRMEPPLGLGHLQGVLEEGGIDNDFYDFSNALSVEEVVDRLPPAPVYAAGVMATTHLYVAEVFQELRRRFPKALFVVGGPNPTALPESAQSLGADLLIRGEAEDALLWALRRFFDGTRPPPVVEGWPRQDLDSLPFPKRPLDSLESYRRRLNDRPVLSLLSSRGCPNRCTHCNSRIMGGGSGAPRYRSAGSVCAEIASLKAITPMFRFNDDSFSARPREELLKFLERIKQEEIQFRIFARTQDLSSEVCRALVDAGCIHISVGLESLNPQNLRVLGKGGQAGEEERLYFAREAGLKIRAYFIVGLPYDNEQSITEEFQRAAELPIDEFSIYPLIPYPGTAFYEHPGRFGYRIIQKDWSRYIQIGQGGDSSFALEHENFGPEEVRRWRTRAESLLSLAGARHSRESEVAR